VTKTDANPTMLMYAARRPRHRDESLYSNKIRYIPQVIKDAVTLGSLPQDWPQAWGAEMEPERIVRLIATNPIVRNSRINSSHT